MKQEFSPQYVMDNRGCYDPEDVERLSFYTKETITPTDIVESEISIKDKYWFVCKKLATKEESQRIAIGVAEIVLPIFENRYPDDKRPREAIEAAKQFLAGHISVEHLLEKRRAADAAAAAAAAAAADAYAAYAAAYAAAAAADAAAYAAAAAAAADAYAAYAAAYAAAAAAKKQLLDYLRGIVKGLVELPNPEVSDTTGVEGCNTDDKQKKLNR